MTKERNVVHATFTLTRNYKAPRARVFEAFADLGTKQQWFGVPNSPNHSMDFRIGGREHNHGEGPDGGSYRYDATYLDIVPDERIIYAYDMDLGKGTISVSVTTIEMTDSDDGTALKFTEQGAYLDGFDKPEIREHGSNELLKALARVVED